MSDAEQSRADLRAKIQSLKATVQSMNAEVERLRAHDRVHRALLSATSHVTFTAKAQPDGTLEGVWVDEPTDDEPTDERVDDLDLRDLLTQDPCPRHCRKALTTGGPITFEVSPNEDGGWVVHLVADASRAESGRLEGVVRPKSTPEREADRPPEQPLRGDRTHVSEPVAPTDEAWTSARRSAGGRAAADRPDPLPPDAPREADVLHPELVELLPDAILVVDSDDRIRFANSAAVRLAGSESEASLLGTSFWEYVHPGSRARTRERRQRLRQGSRVDFSEARLIRPDGQPIPVEMASVPITYHGEPAALTAVRDLSGRERMAETISRTLTLFDKAFHLGPAALLITRLRDGLILEASERMGTLSGVDANALIGQSIDDVDVGLDAAVRRDLARELVRHGSVHDREVRLRFGGETRVVLCSAERIEVDGFACALVSLVDVTERKRATVAEQESRTLLQKVFRASPAPINIWRFDDGRYVEVNEAMCALVGYDHDALVGRRPGDLDLWADDAQRRELMERLKHEEAVYDFEVRFRKASGDVVTTLSSFQRIQVKGERCILSVMTDITQREEARQALVDAKVKAEEVAHFRSAVLANMTHEVRTPLTVILGFTTMLRDGVQEEYQRFVDLIERSGRRLLLTLDSLLDLAQLEAGTLEPSPETQCVCDAVHSVTGPLAPRAHDQGLDFALDLPDEHVHATFDHELFGRVLHHLVDNAVKFTESGGIVVRVRSDDETVSVDVEDTGVGIEDSFLPRIYEAFAQESEGIARTHQGSGLGLTVSKRIVERIGGTLSIASTKGEGTTVTLTLPRVHKSTSIASRPSTDPFP